MAQPTRAESINNPVTLQPLQSIWLGKYQLLTPSGVVYCEGSITVRDLGKWRDLG